MIDVLTQAKNGEKEIEKAMKEYRRKGMPRIKETVRKIERNIERLQREVDLLNTRMTRDKRDIEKIIDNNKARMIHEIIPAIYDNQELKTLTVYRGSGETFLNVLGHKMETRLDNTIDYLDANGTQCRIQIPKNGSYHITGTKG